MFDSEIIEFIEKKFMVYNLIESPFYKRNTSIKRGNLQFRYTKEEEKYFEDIKKNPQYFLSNNIAPLKILDPLNPSQTDIRALQMKPYAGIITPDILKKLGY
jgi:hypothetical protein